MSLIPLNPGKDSKSDRIENTDVSFESVSSFVGIHSTIDL